MARTPLARTARGVTVFVLLAVVVSSVTLPAAAATGYSVSIQTPAEFSVGDNRVEVTIDNTASGTALFSPIVEVPLETGLSAPADPAPVVKSSGGSRTWSVQSSTITSGDSLYVYGRDVPAGDSRTYVFTLTVDSAGDKTIQTDVRPLYNESNNVRTQTTATAADVGTLTVEVVNDSAGPLPGATVTIDGADRAGPNVSETVAEGSHTVSLTVDGTTYPDVSVAVPPGGDANVTYRHGSLSDPAVVVSKGTPAVVATNTLARGVSAPGNATSRARYELSFLADVPDGDAVVAVSDPTQFPDQYHDVTASVDSQSVMPTRDGATTQVTLSQRGLLDVSVEYVGYPVGDATRDSTVDAGDATHIAQSVATGQDGDSYGDVDGDGAVTVVDAMLVAQYDAGNRTADYRRA